MCGCDYPGRQCAAIKHYRNPVDEAETCNDNERQSSAETNDTADDAGGQHKNGDDMPAFPMLRRFIAQNTGRNACQQNYCRQVLRAEMKALARLET